MRRAAGCERSSDCERREMTAGILTEPKSLARDSAPTLEAAIPR